ncbi:hypothetical protein JKP88DRAFT_223075 [Tribonema minus]|uniref:Uncharacterized protein n=1 Tax=Tribonema minus TaxID=303371 RepID=A0A836CE32_9STRA|nr:hypothetical protein JKP88DRAFT_223075 [Tribonema minus]
MSVSCMLGWCMHLSLSTNLRRAARSFARTRAPCGHSRFCRCHRFGRFWLALALVAATSSGLMASARCLSAGLANGTPASIRSVPLRPGGAAALAASRVLVPPAVPFAAAPIYMSVYSMRSCAATAAPPPCRRRLALQRGLPSRGDCCRRH